MDHHRNHHQINKAIKYHTILMPITIITIIKSHHKQIKAVAIITMHLILHRHSNQTFSIQNHPTAIRTIIAGFLLHYTINYFF